MTLPFADGSISIRLYGHAADVDGILEALLSQARRAESAGFDGITVSEHHGGFAGYLPNPLQMAGWLLYECKTVWSAPAPLLLPLRPAGLVAEEAAWLAARFPGRVGIGVAAGSLEQDFAIAEAALDDTLGRRFGIGLATLSAAFNGRAEGPLAADPAIAALTPGSVPLVAAAMSRPAVRRVAACGAGLLSDSLSTRQRLRQLIDWYGEEGGTGPRVVTRWVWVGNPDPSRIAAESTRYTAYTPADRQQNFAEDFDTISGEPEEVADQLLQVVEETGGTALNLRVHTIGAPASEVLDQIEVIGEQVLPAVRGAWPSAPTL